MIEIQRFTLETIENIGGIVVPLEYALVDVIIPEEYKDFFQNKTELKLAFDFEVAQENLDAEFITFGSYIFNSVVDIANTSALTTVRYAVIDRLSCSNPSTKIRQSLSVHDHSKINILKEESIMVPVILFNFRAGYSSDIQVTEDVSIWVNTYNHSICQDLRGVNIFYENQPIYDLSIDKKFSIVRAFEVAYKQAKDECNNRSKDYSREADLKKETHRIKSYYKELELENNKRLHRKGISEEKKMEIESKTEALKLECSKQLTEMKEKHTIKVEIHLMNGIMYYVPCIKYWYELIERKNIEKFSAIYNPILKRFENHEHTISF
jgi:hypothetical protein